MNQENDLNELYREARCGLFHTGMVQGKVIINYNFPDPINFPDPDTIKVNPKILLEDIINDFNQYLDALRTDPQSRMNFNSMFSNL